MSQTRVKSVLSLPIYLFIEVDATFTDGFELI